MLTIQNQPELFGVRALLYWSCARLLASKLFMKQILKRRLSARPHLICPESRIDARASSLSLSFSLCSLKIQTSFFLPVPRQTQSDTDRNAKTDFEKTHFFSPPFYVAVTLIYCLRQLCICGLKKGVPELFRQGQFTDFFGNGPSLFHASVLGDVVTV